MKKEVREGALAVIRRSIGDKTIKINRNSKQINDLADENAWLKRIRTQEIYLLREFQK